MKTLGDIKRVLLQRDLLKEVSGEAENRLLLMRLTCDSREVTKDAVHLQGSGVQAAVFAGCGKKRRCGLYQRDKDGSTGAGADRKGYPKGDGGGIGVVLGL